MEKTYTKEEKELIDYFQSDYIRRSEETFAQIFSENSHIRLFFINNNEAYTDGSNIVVDPLFHQLFNNSKILFKMEVRLVPK